MKYYIIAGERSGDLHAANLMAELKALDPAAEFRFWGGDQMQAQGGTMVKHYQQMAFMGVWEVIKNLRTIRKFMDYCKSDILSWKPDGIILVDYAGFNMRIAKFLKENGLKSIYYISPKVWAWNTKRAFKIKKYVDKMFVIMPFEKDFFKKFDFEVEYVGNPLLDEIKKWQPNPDFLRQNQLEGKQIIAVLPGSRKQEIEHMLGQMMALVPDFPDYQFIIAAVTSLPKDFYTKYEGVDRVKIVYDQTYDVLHVAKAALVTSGTATLETALFNVPQVMCYKTSLLTYIIGKQLVVIPYYSLPNLVAGKVIIKELIQYEFNLNNLRSELQLLLSADYSQRMKSSYAEMRAKMETPNASANTAKGIIKFIRNQ
ncbi:MAG: lipid-A-disaccharide synthase [Cytophagales bacterium]|nr:lipid-A-disaccharide synthase [Cytophagales bacterium]